MSIYCLYYNIIICKKGDMGQFFTPLKVVDEMINMIDIKENMKVCDPACRSSENFY